MKAIVFSRDRPAQLDLLLKSIRKNFNGLFASTVVLYKATSPEFQGAYDTVEYEHKSIVLIPETDFYSDVSEMVEAGGQHIAFLTDDDVFYRPWRYTPYPWEALDRDPDLLTVSLRLGENTTYCYPMRCEQSFPYSTEESFDLRKYIWRSGQWDFGYPGSLDGNVFRRHDLQDMLWASAFINPNELEDALVQATKKVRQKLMGVYPQSCLVNIPSNLVNRTHNNRHGETHPTDVASLNYHYLRGRRLSLLQMDLNNIDAAHCERQFIFN